MPGAMIRVEGVTRSFGSVEALRGVDLTVPRGSVLGLLGPNGAGKTTLVRILTTLLAPDGGRAEVAGLDVVTNAQALRSRIGLAGQYAAVDETLTGRENLVMVGQLYHLPRAEAARRADEVLERIALSDARDRPARTYSGGMRRRLDLAASLVGRPEVLFLDEPTTGLDPRSRLDLWSLIEELVDDGTTVLLTTQYLEEADELADSIAVIDHGLLIAEGTADDLKTRVGGDVLELRVAPGGDPAAVAEALAPIASGEAHVEVDVGRVVVPVAEGAQSLVAAVRLLDDRGVALIDLGLRRPTLDEVFLTLTGRSADGDADAEPPSGRRSRRGGRRGHRDRPPADAAA